MRGVRGQREGGIDGGEREREREEREGGEREEKKGERSTESPYTT